MKTFSIQEINDVLKGTIVGNISEKITAPEQLEMASSTEISFIGNKKFEKYWENSKACVAVVNEDIGIEPGENRAFIKVKNADLAMSSTRTLCSCSATICCRNSSNRRCRFNSSYWKRN